MNFSYPDHFKEYIKSLESAPIGSNGTQQILGWNAIVFAREGNPIGGGTAETIELAQRIAIAESLEKLEFIYGLSQNEKEKFRSDEFPTRCGLAAGFEEAKTLSRSLAEGLERWIWSKWIDDGYVVPEVAKPKLSGLAAQYYCHFDDVKFYEMQIQHNEKDLPSPLRFCATIGIKNRGAFPGSRVCVGGEDPWTHSLVEAWRNVQILNSLSTGRKTYPFLAERLEFFGSNAAVALASVTRADLLLWPRPVLDFSATLARPKHGYFLIRSLFKDYIPWHKGSHDRFVF